MDIQEKSHAAINYTLGATGLTSPFWLKLMSDATGCLQFFTALGGAALIIIQLYRTLKKKE